MKQVPTKKKALSDDEGDDDDVIFMESQQWKDSSTPSTSTMGVNQTDDIDGEDSQPVYIVELDHISIKDILIQVRVTLITLQ